MKLEELRKSYINISDNNPDKEWKKLESKLGDQNAYNSPVPYSKIVLSLIGALIILGGFGGVVQAAEPGDTFYPIKVLADNIVAKATNNPSLIIERRGDDVLKVSNDPKKLDDAIEHYQEAVKDSENMASSSARKEEVKKEINIQGRKFEDEARKNPASSEKLRRAASETQKGNGEVKGLKTHHFNRNK